MANLKDKLGQIPGGSQVVEQEAYTYFIMMANAFKVDKGLELKIEQAYMSKYEVTDELRKMVKDKKETDPVIGPLLNKANKIEEILNIPPPATAPSTTPQQTYRYIPVDGDAFVSIKVMYGEINVATKEYQKPTYTEETALAALKASVDANGIVGDNGTTYAPGSVTTTTPTPTPPLFNADSYPKLEAYINGLKESDFSPPLHQKAAGMDASTTLNPYPYYPGQDIRQSAKFFSIGPDANMKPDTYTWLYNNCAFYGFLPYGHPTQNAVYYIGAEKLKQKIKTENNVPKSMSSLLKTELSKDIVTVTVEKIVSFSTTGESEFPMDPSIDLIPQALIANKEKQIQCAIISGVSAQPMRTDVATAMAAMIKAAKADGVNLAINSGFRPAFPAGWPNKKSGGGSAVTSKGVTVSLCDQYSLRTQSRWRGGGTMTEEQRLGEGASKFDPATARPNSSQHGNGVAVDLNTGGFPHYPANPFIAGGKNMSWLNENAHRFGFIRAVSSEAWHWEYYPPNKPNVEGKHSNMGPYAIVPKSNSNWGPYNTDNWKSKGLFVGNVGSTV